MRRRMVGSRRRLVASVTVAAALVAAITGCAGSAPTAAGSASGSPSASAAAGASGSGSCVADVPATIAAGDEQPNTAPVPADLAEALDAAARAGFDQASTPGAIVGVRGPRGTFVAAYGAAAEGDGAPPMEPGLHTRIGSITKTFTGTVILQLAEEGALSLDDTVDEYVDGIPNGDEITLRMMADMTSGIASFTLNEPFVEDYFADPSQIIPPQEIVDVSLPESPRFAPGAQFEYSNTNTVLLGMIAEQVTGQTIGELFGQRVFEPLGLTATVWPADSPSMPEPFARGYTLQGANATPEAPEDVTDWNPSWMFTAGEMISTIDDLLVYGHALGTGAGLLSEESQTERLESFPGAAGYGLALGCIDGWVGHTGELPGYNTSLFYDTTTDTTVAVQTNSDISSGDCDVSPVLASDDRSLGCSSPATRIFVEISAALGHPFTPNPQH